MLFGFLQFTSLFAQDCLLFFEAYPPTEPREGHLVSAGPTQNAFGKKTYHI